MKQIRKYFLVGIVLLFMFALSACTGVKAKGELVIHRDGSGSRKILAYIWKKDNNHDGAGITYYYLKKHDRDLETYIRNIYTEKVEGSERWLEVTVDDSNERYETVTLFFEFSSLEEYQTRLKSLVFDEKYRSLYEEPKIFLVNEKVTVYRESESTMNAIMECVKEVIMADNDMFDIGCTKDGVALNENNSFESISDSAVSVMSKADGDGVALNLHIDGRDAERISLTDSEMLYYEELPGVNYYTIACVGDSITEGMGSSSGLKGSTSYPAVLSKLLNNSEKGLYSVKNFGKSATTALSFSTYSYWGSTEYTESLKCNPDVVIISFGANDAAKANWDPERYKSDYISLIKKYQNLPTSPVVYLAYTTYIEIEPEDGFRDTIQKEVLAIQNEISAELGCKILDFNEITRMNTDQMSDGVHPNDNLYEQMAEYVYNALCSEEVISLEKSDADEKVKMIDGSTKLERGSRGFNFDTKLVYIVIIPVVIVAAIIIAERIFNSRKKSS